MKNLDLSAYGVSEMKNAEMQIIDGGGFFLIGLAIGIAIGSLCDRDSSSDFWEGYNAGYKAFS